MVMSVLDGSPESESASYGVNSKISSIRSKNLPNFGFLVSSRVPCDPATLRLKS